MSKLTETEADLLAQIRALTIEIESVHSEVIEASNRLYALKTKENILIDKRMILVGELCFPSITEGL